MSGSQPPEPDPADRAARVPPGDLTPAVGARRANTVLARPSGHDPDTIVGHDRPGAGHGAEDHREAAHQPLRDAMRARLLRLDTLRPETKLLLAAVVAQLVVAALLVLVRNTHLASIQSDNFAHTTATIPILVFVASVVFCSVAWGLILAGAFRADWGIRLAVIAIFMWALWTEHGVLGNVGRADAIACYLVVALILAIGVASWFPESAGGHWAVADAEPGGQWRTRRRLVPPLLMVCVGALYLIAWLANRSAGHVDVFTDGLAQQLADIQFFLIPLLVLAGSEFGSWSDFIIDRAVRRVRASIHQWLFGGLVLVASGLILWNGLRSSMPDNGGDVAPELLLAAVVAAVVVVLFRVARPRGNWPRHIPFVVLAVIALVDSTVGYIAEQQLGHADPLFADKVYGVSATFWIVAAIVTLIALIVLRHRLSGFWTVAGCLIVVIGTIDGLTALDEMGTVVHPFGLNSSGSAGHLVTNAPYLGVEGLKAVAAMATIAVVLYALGTRAFRRLMVPISLLITLTVGLELLTWIDLLFGKTTDTAGRVALFAAVVLVLVLVWELASSGEGLTNLHSSGFPRESRVMLYGGYVLLVSAAVLFYSSLHDAKSATLLHSQFDAEEWVRDGILFLGVPLVITLFLIGLKRWQQASEPAADVTPRS
ncbi:MAG TPA: hypothetical protein VHZ02_10445 [Acidimicrobiales bacterium]|nr:hypothetical protein [Acidimicrobiales bacterium]